MANVEVTNSGLVVQLRGVRALLSGRKRMVIPWTHVVSARKADDLARQSPGMRSGVNTNIPGVLKAGTFTKGGKRSFWDVRHPGKAILIELRGERFDQLVLDVDDPSAVLSSIKAAQ